MTVDISSFALCQWIFAPECEDIYMYLIHSWLIFDSYWLLICVSELPNCSNTTGMIRQPGSVLLFVFQVGWWCCVQELCQRRGGEKDKGLHQWHSQIGVPQEVHGEIREINLTLFLLWNSRTWYQDHSVHCGLMLCGKKNPAVDNCILEMCWQLDLKWMKRPSAK